MADAIETDKTAEGSLPSDATRATPRSDAIEESSPSQTETSSRDVKENETLVEYLERTQVTEANKETDDKASVDAKEEVAKSDEVEPKTEKSEKEADEADATEEQTPEDEKGPVPYERFEAVTKDRQQLRTELEGLKQSQQPYMNIVNYCQENNISAQDFNRALEVQAAISRGDAEGALKMLLPVVDALQGMTGGKLPPDLQAAVDSGDMSTDYAKRLAKAEARVKYGEVSSKQTQENLKSQQMALLRKQLDDATGAWETRMRSTDPDYKPKANGEAEDGKWELVRDKFNALKTQADDRGQPMFQPKSVQDVVALYQRAYEMINKTFKKLNGNRPPTRRTLSSLNSSKTSEKGGFLEAKTMKEAVDLYLAEQGHR
jgi:hypothetical protein